MATFAGQCLCGTGDTPFDASERVAELIIDGQVWVKLLSDWGPLR
jgi:hypothetical protein